jgi:hypothetical protein
MDGGSKKHDTTGIAFNEHVTEGKVIANIETDATTVVKKNINTKATITTKAGGTQVEVATVSEQAVIKNLSPQSGTDVTIQTGQQTSFIQGLSDKSTDDLLLMAREAYWNNGLDEAAAIYQQLIQREPDVVAHKGELGNVYWRQGFPEKSASLYAEIALPMIKDGHADRVANMVGFIELFHPDKAAEIKKTLQGLNLD